MNGTIEYPAVDKESLIKLSTGTRGNVQFKPPKKMKKRRQLDALVSNGKKLPRRKQSGHELLRSNDSESSELEEFSVLDSKWNKRWSDSSCWSTCYMLTSVLVMATCILACAALIWMHLELKQNFKELREKMDLVEGKKAVTPDEFRTLQTQVQAANRNVTEILSGKKGLEALSQTIENIQTQISVLKSVQPNAPSAEPGSTEIKSLAVTVASVGSDLQTMQTDLASLKTNLQTQLQDITNRVSHLENPNGREGGSSVSVPDNIMEQIMSINSTLILHIDQFNTDKAKLEAQMDALNKLSRALQDQITSLNMQVTNVTQTQEQLQKSITLQQQAVGENPSVTTAERNTTDEISELKEQFDELKKVVQQLNNGNMSQLSPPLESRSESTGGIDFAVLSKDHQDLLTFKADIFQDINNLNASLASLNHTVDILQKDVDSLFVNTNGAVRNVSQLVDMVTSILKSKEFQKTESVTLTASPKEPSNAMPQADDKNNHEQSSKRETVV